MVRIRLKRVGARQKPFYRIIVADQRASQKGSFIEQIGTYDPKPDKPLVNLDENKFIEWIKKGAQPSDSVKQITRSMGLMDKINAS